MKYILSFVLVFALFSVMVTGDLNVRCHQQRFRHQYWRDSLREAFNHLKGQAGSWDESPTYRRGVRDDAQYYTRARCFDVPRHECRRCVHHLTEVSWRECEGAINGVISNNQCQIRWDRDQFEDFEVPY